MSTPDLQMQTLFVLNDEGRIVTSREPSAYRVPVFSLIRSTTACAWAARAGLPDELYAELVKLLNDEPPVPNLEDSPVHSEKYVSLVGGEIISGPAFTFPDKLETPADVVQIEDEELLQRNFNGWAKGEISGGRSPVMAVTDDGVPVSICCCARRSDIAAEAGLETAEAYRGRGYGARVTSAWALAVRKSGRVPLYSTSWDNQASLAVAHKLGLIPYACDWSIHD